MCKHSNKTVVYYDGITDIGNGPEALFFLARQCDDCGMLLEAEAVGRVIALANNHRDLMTKDKIGEMGRNNTHNNNNNNDGMVQGTSADYLTARIARDNPAILEDMKQGKYRSVRAAAIDAGIIDPDKARRYQLPTDPAAAGRYLSQRVDHEWLMECVDAFMKACSRD